MASVNLNRCDLCEGHPKLVVVPEIIDTPRRLCSPHSTFLRQSGHSFEIATALVSLLIGAGYDAYVVSGYAIKDITEKIMCRIDPPLPQWIEEEEAKHTEVKEGKYKLKPPRDLRSKFLMMMAQREIDKEIAENEEIAEQARLKILEEEKRPLDELEGQRIHSWVLVMAGQSDIPNNFFIEPSTGLSYPIDSEVYCRVESIWNHENYWVNMQDCPNGIGELDYNLDNINKWEHLLVGEPFIRRKAPMKNLDEEENNDMYDEKHLDMPFSWSMRIEIPNHVLRRRFPNGSKTTFYKRTCIEQFAQYICSDGLVTRITKFQDFECTYQTCIEELYENRSDKLYRLVHDYDNKVITIYFHPGREDSVIKYIYHEDGTPNSENRTIFFNSKARFDALSKIECTANNLSKYYENREDKLYYRQVIYALGKPNQNHTGIRKPIKITQSNEHLFIVDGFVNKENRRISGEEDRRIISEKCSRCCDLWTIIEKFEKHNLKNPNENIAYREFCIFDRKIYIKYHYGKGNVTASTRTFIKPSISEMGEGMIFKPELTYGYQAEIGTKPLSNLQLFILFEEQLKEEQKVINYIRDTETQVKEFLLLRAQEEAFCKLDVSLYNKEQNVDFRLGMLEKEEEQRMNKVKEVEDEIDYLAPYLARLRHALELTYQEAVEAKSACLADFKNLLLQRAINLQKTFEISTEQLETLKNWYAMNHSHLSSKEETQYFEKVNSDMFYLYTLEKRLTRHKELSPIRYEALVKYLDNHPMLQVLRI